MFVALFRFCEFGAQIILNMICQYSNIEEVKQYRCVNKHENVLHVRTVRYQPGSKGKPTEEKKTKCRETDGIYKLMQKVTEQVSH
eukprot:c39597_g1_i1 orf=1309-1563(+)